MKTPWAVILCKFTDGDDEPFPKEYYNDLFTANNSGSPWNMIRYFSDYSHGALDLTGTQVFGWYQLDKSVKNYNNEGQAARDKLIGWARAAAVADGVDLSPFFSVVACANLWQDIGAASSGVVAQGAMTLNPTLLGHEMGHVYGLNHSRINGSTDDYKDPWDIMSAANAYKAPDQEFTQIGPGLNASNMRSRGWLDESRVWKSSGGNDVDATITLRPLVRRDLSGFLAAETPSGYLVEFRVREAWDAAIPRPAVLVHGFYSGHSYLMPGNSGSRDLIAGDSFGDPEPVVGPELKFLFLSFERVDVLSIDASAEEATVRIRYNPYDPTKFDPVVMQIAFGPTPGSPGLVLDESGKLKPIYPLGPPVDPSGPFRRLTPAQRDVLVGLAVSVLARNISNPEARRLADIVGLETIRSATERLLDARGAHWPWR